MNIPVGEIIEENVPLKETNLSAKISLLMRESFTGYIVLTSEGQNGVEEGLMIIEGGKAIGAIYEYLSFNKAVFGGTALGLLLNSGLATFGVMDVAKLSRQQVELIVAFNDKIEMDAHLSILDLEKIFPKQYNENIADKHIADELKKKESKFDLFKKLGLGGMK